MRYDAVRSIGEKWEPPAGTAEYTKGLTPTGEGRRHGLPFSCFFFVGRFLKNVGCQGFLKG